jgi:CubicO group peptidase (beta-lactamase class C family)
MRISKRYAAMIGLAAAGLLGAGHAARCGQERDPAAIFEAAFKAHSSGASLGERLAAAHVPGLSLAVIRGGRIEWTLARGVLEAGTPRPVEVGSLFEAASVTKAVVAAAVLHYVEKGRLDLDADVNVYLKSWKVPDTEFTRERKVTLRGLLSHQAGMPSTSMGYDEGAGVPTLVQVLAGQAPARNKAAVPEFVPGRRWQYSNVGYALVQMVLEDALGRPLTAITDETIFMPLGLKTATLAYPLPASLRGREARPHDADGRPGRPAMHPTALAQGGLMAAPAELAEVLLDLMRAYGGGPSKIMGRSWARAMVQAEAAVDPRLYGTPFGDGLGMLVKGQGPGLIAFHAGNNAPGSVCWMIGFPERGEGAVLMLNGDGGERLAFEILSVLDGLYGWPGLM